MSGSSRRAAKQQSSRTPVIIAAVVVVGIAAAVIAVLLSGGDDGSSADTTPSTRPGTVIAQTHPVEVTGEPLVPLTDPAADEAVGVAAPALVGSSFSGTPTSVTPGEGTAYLVVYLAHWCPHCQAEVPVLIDWQEQGSVPEGLQVVAVSTAVSPERPNYPPSEWLGDEGWPWPVLADDELGSAAAAYGVSGFPFLVVVDAEGNVAGRTSGEKTLEELDAFVTQSLGA